MVQPQRKSTMPMNIRLATRIARLFLGLEALLGSLLASCCPSWLGDGRAALDSPDASTPYPCPAAHGFYDDNLTYVSQVPDDGFWQSATPESQGLDPMALAAAATELSRQSSALSLLVIRNQFLVLEQYFHDSQANQSNNLHSASKCILSALVGIALDRGLLKGIDQTVGELLPRYHMKDAATASITLRNLLTMSSGLAWTEDQTECTIQAAPDWVQAILDLPITSTPGTRFMYSTGNSHLISAILTAATGQSTADFATTTLFQPLGITFEHWGHDPQGISSGGYNFYMTPRSFARFALMVFDQGTLRGQQIIPAAWLVSSIRPEQPPDTGYDYGYYYWLPKIGHRAVAKMWGFGGQLAYLIPSEKMVIVITNDTHQSYPEPDGDTFITTYILPAIRPHRPPKGRPSHFP
jgi:CubicO group peptidase (beta-lactamase class C family)